MLRHCFDSAHDHFTTKPSTYRFSLVHGFITFLKALPTTSLVLFNREQWPFGWIKGRRFDVVALQVAFVLENSGLPQIFGNGRRKLLLRKLCTSVAFCPMPIINCQHSALLLTSKCGRDAIGVLVLFVRRIRIVSSLGPIRILRCKVEKETGKNKVAFQGSLLIPKSSSILNLYGQVSSRILLHNKVAALSGNTAIPHTSM